MSDEQRAQLTAHGHSADGHTSPTYVSWAAMIQRCANPNKGNYQ